MISSCNKLFYCHFKKLYLCVRQRGVNLQNKMDLREIFRIMCLKLDNTAAS